MKRWGEGMKTVIGRKSLSTNGVRNEVVVAFGLILLCLLVFLAYLFPGVNSFFETRSSMTTIIGIIFLIVGLGFLIIWRILDPVLKLSREAKHIADGDFNRDIELFRDDEIGELGQAINRMTRRMRENVEELKKFSQTTEQINTEINKRILTLSNLLQISNLISQNAQFKEVVEVGVGKCLSSGILNQGCMILKDLDSSEFQVHFISGARASELLEKGIKNTTVRFGEGILGKALLKQSPMVIDKETTSNSEIEQFRSLFGMSNAILVPINSKGNVYGLLVAGNDSPAFVFSKSEHELVQVVARQIAIAYTNDLLQREIQKLEVKDRLTGLFNQSYLRNRLNEEIKRAASFQRPCSLLLLTIDNFSGYHESHGNIAAENILIKIGNVLKESISETDKAARFGDHEFAIILPEKNKRQSIVVADNVRRKIEGLFSQEKEPKNRLTCTGAVTENPLDGVTADELIEKGREILKGAESQGGNRICYKV